MIQHLMNLGLPRTHAAAALHAHDTASQRVKEIASPPVACVCCFYEDRTGKRWPAGATHQTCAKHAQMPADSGPVLPELPRKKAQ